MTPAMFGLTYASFAAFEQRADMSVAHHAVRLAAAVVMGAILFVSSGSDDSVRAPQAAAAAAHHING